MEHDVVPGCVEEPRPREHLLTRALEAMHEYDRGLTDGGSDEPAVQVDAVAAREIDALDGQVDRSRRIARPPGDEEVRAGDRRTEPCDQDRDRGHRRDAPQPRRAHSAACAAQRSMIPR